MSGGSALPRILSTTGVPITIVLVAVVVVFQLLTGVFLRPSAVQDYLTNAVPLLLITVGVAVVIVGGGIDLSVGTVAGLSAGTSLWALSSGAPAPVGVLAGLATGAAFGWFNGFLITRFAISDFIVTLATLNVAAGLLIVLTEVVTLQGIEAPAFSALVYGRVLGVPASFVIAALCVVLLQFVLTRTVLGRRVFAIGVAADAASNAGVDVAGVRRSTFLVSGVLAGAAGVLLASRLGTVQAFLGVGYEFTAIAGAVVGGVSLAGGRGSAWAAVVGGLLLASLQQGLRLYGVDPVYLSVVTAACIIAGVVFDRAVHQAVLGRALRRPPDEAPPPPPARRHETAVSSAAQSRGAS